MIRLLPIFCLFVGASLALAATPDGLLPNKTMTLDGFSYEQAKDAKLFKSRVKLLGDELNSVEGTLNEAPSLHLEFSPYFGFSPVRDVQSNKSATATLNAQLDKLAPYVSPNLQPIEDLTHELNEAIAQKQSCKKRCKKFAQAVSAVRERREALIGLITVRSKTAQIEHKLIKMQLQYLQGIQRSLKVRERRPAEAKLTLQKRNRKTIDTQLPAWANAMRKKRETRKLAEAEAERNRKVLLDDIEGACGARVQLLESRDTYETQIRDIDQTLIDLEKQKKSDSEKTRSHLGRINTLIESARAGDNVGENFDDEHRQLSARITKLDNQIAELKGAKSAAEEDLENAKSGLRNARAELPLTEKNADNGDPCAVENRVLPGALAQAQLTAAQAKIDSERERVRLFEKKAAYADLKVEQAQQRFIDTRRLLRLVLPHLSAAYERQHFKMLFPFNPTFFGNLAQNLRLLLGDVVSHGKQRINDLRALPGKMTGWSGLSALISGLFWLAVILLIGRGVYRRIDPWLITTDDWLKSLSSLQSVLPYLHSTLKIVSVIVHPAVVLAIAWTTANYVGFNQPEIWTVYTVMMWFYLYRILKQTTQTLFIGPTWETERARLLVPILDRSPVLKRDASTTVLSERSLHLIIAYFILRIAILDTIEALLGQDYMFHLAASLVNVAQWGVIVTLVVWWRQRVVAAYMESGPSWGRNIAQKHMQSVWMSLAVLPMVTAIAAKQFVPWLQETFSETGPMGTLTNFLSRRRMEQAARERNDGDNRYNGTLPKPYTQQFTVTPLTDEPYLLAPLVEVQLINDVYQFWAKEKREGSVAIVGEAGMGKTTLINVVLDSLPVGPGDIRRSQPKKKLSTENDVIEFLSQTFEFSPAPQTLDELEKAILKDPTPVVVIDDSHQFFLKKMGGMAALDAFVHVVTVTSTNVFWITSFNAYAWYFIKNLNRSEPPFRHIVHLKPWSADELEGLIMSRNATTDYQPSFQDLVVNRGQGNHAQYEVIKTKRSYFRLLGDVASGNPAVALGYWLSSLRREPYSHKKLRVGLYNPEPPRALINASDDVLFALTCIAEHASLTPAELAAVLRMSHAAVHRMIAYCEENNFVCYDDGLITLAFGNYRQIVKTLSMQSFIYFQHGRSEN